MDKLYSISFIIAYEDGSPVKAWDCPKTYSSLEEAHLAAQAVALNCDELYDNDATVYYRIYD